MIDYDYPDIFLGEAVQKDLLITDGEVTVVGDDYTVTDDTVTITNSELETEAFELHQSINSDMQLRFGSCESAYISFVFRTQATISSLIGKVLKVYIIPNHEASKILQIGVFKVQTDRLSYNGKQRQITAYDAMYDILNSDVADWYNTELPDASTTKYLGVLIQSFLQHFGLTAESMTNIVNATRPIGRTIDPVQLSGGDVIRAMCELNGVFGVINNEGNFRFKKLVANMRTTAPENIWEIPVSDYMDIHFDDYDSKKIDAVRIITDEASDTYNFNPDPENMYTISGNFLISDYDRNAIHRVLMPLRGTLYNNYYTACTVNALGNPVLEPGDSIKVITKEGETYTYILERHLRGIQALRDTFTARGEEYSSESLNSVSSRFNMISRETSQASQAAIATASNDFVEIIRNIGYRLLDEPSNVSIEYDEDNNEVSLKWTDPADISTLEPVPCEWAGTVVVRNDDHAPIHRWDGTLIEDSTTRDEYSVNALVDNTVEDGKTYYYGIFPYHVAVDDVSNPIKHYRYTKVVNIFVPEKPEPPVVKDTWVAKSWSGASPSYGSYVWVNEGNVYYSYGSNQYVLNKATGSWSNKTWGGLSNFNGTDIWTDGANVYYSKNSSQYVLNTLTSTWESKTWNNYNPADGDYIWTDGENIYYSEGYTQYILDKATNTWNTKNWIGLTSFFGNRIWTDGINIYYSSDTTQYMLDKTTGIWVAKTWNGYSNITGTNVWTDGINIYYSNGKSNQYVLDKNTSTWVAKTWNGYGSITGGHVWTDGTDIYYSFMSGQYVLT